VIEMEKLANKLADLQTELITEKNAAENDPAVVSQNGVIKWCEEQLADAIKARDAMLVLYAIPIKEIDRQIEEIKVQIIDAWDGDKKTIVYSFGTMKFRTTMSLNIIDEPLVLENMMDHLATAEEIMEYITGFNKTNVKRYMGVHKLPADVAELVSKTTVEFEMV